MIHNSVFLPISMRFTERLLEIVPVWLKLNSINQGNSGNIGLSLYTGDFFINSLSLVILYTTVVSESSLKVVFMMKGMNLLLLLVLIILLVLLSFHHAHH